MCFVNIYIYTSKNNSATFIMPQFLSTASKYLAELSGHYGSSSSEDEESVRAEGKTQNRVHDQTKGKTSHSSANGSRAIGMFELSFLFSRK